MISLLFLTRGLSYSLIISVYENIMTRQRELINVWLRTVLEYKLQWLHTIFDTWYLSFLIQAQMDHSWIYSSSSSLIGIRLNKETAVHRTVHSTWNPFVSQIKCCRIPMTIIYDDQSTTTYHVLLKHFYIQIVFLIVCYNYWGVIIWIGSLPYSVPGKMCPIVTTIGVWS